MIFSIIDIDNLKSRAIISIVTYRLFLTDTILSKGWLIDMEKIYAPVTTAQELREAMERCRNAQKKFATYTQAQVDKIFLAAATAANQMRIPLAKQAVAETGTYS